MPRRENATVRVQRGSRRPRRAGRATSDAERRRLAQRARERALPRDGKGAVLWCDGGSRGNPGPAAYAYVLDLPGGPTVTFAERFGPSTVSIAEYRAVLAGLIRAAELDVTGLEVRTDAQVVADQLAGERPEPRNPELRALLRAAREAEVGLGRVRYRWIPREANGRANALVLTALDGATA